MIEKEMLTLKQLVSKFEENDLDLTQIPQDLVDEYGYACLSNSLMFKEPSIPKYNLEIAEYVKFHQFETLDSLINYIKKLPNDIDKLFGIFSYVTQNIKYDEDLCKLDKVRQFSLEEIFTLKKAICNGYTSFIEDMSKLVEIDSKRINIKHYSNLSKGKNYDALNWPKEIKSDHASIMITIDGIPFISEPTWSINNHFQNEKYDFNFQPNFFLIPLYKSLCDHYPIEECKEFLKPIDIPFSHFFQASKVSPFGYQLKTETNPFVKVTCESGYIKDTFSCIGPVNSVGFDLLIQKKNGFQEIPIDGLTSYRIIQTKLPNHPERCRFETYILFPEVGLYQIVMYINTKESLVYYVQNNKKYSNSIPLQYNLFHKIKYIPIKPNFVLTKVENGTTIRFTISKKQSNILWEIIRLEDEKGFGKNGEKIDTSYGKYVKLEIPFDNERYEILFVVTFPSNGRYCIQFFFEKEDKRGTFEFYTKYYMDATDIKQGIKYEINPIYYMCKGRKFAPKRFFCNDSEIIVKPNQCYFLVKDRRQSVQIKTASINDVLYFELRKDDKTVLWPKNFTTDSHFREVSFTIPDEYGEYHLFGWVNKKYCIDLFFMYSDYELEDPSEEELNLMKKLKTIIYGDVSKKRDSKKEETEIKKLNVNTPQIKIAMKEKDEKIEENKQNEKRKDTKNTRDIKDNYENAILKRENAILKRELTILKEKMLELVKQNEILTRENIILRNNAKKNQLNKNDSNATQLKTANNTPSRKSLSPISTTVKNTKSTPNKSNIDHSSINNSIQDKNENLTQNANEMNDKLNNKEIFLNNLQNNDLFNDDKVRPVQNLNSTPLKIGNSPMNEKENYQNDIDQTKIEITQLENEKNRQFENNNEISPLQNELPEPSSNINESTLIKDKDVASKNEINNYQINNLETDTQKNENSIKLANKVETLQSSANNKISNKKDKTFNSNSTTQLKNKNSNKTQSNNKSMQSNKLKNNQKTNNKDVKLSRSGTIQPNTKRKLSYSSINQVPTKNINNANMSTSFNRNKSLSSKKSSTISSNNMQNKPLKSNAISSNKNNSLITNDKSNLFSETDNEQLNQTSYISSAPSSKSNVSNKSKVNRSKNLKSKQSNRSKSNLTQMQISDFIKLNIPNNYNCKNTKTLNSTTNNNVYSTSIPKNEKNKLNKTQQKAKPTNSNKTVKK